MVIAIDFDNTFTRDPALWREFVERAKLHGHECVLVTGRSDQGEFGAQVRRDIGDLMPVVFAGIDWKRDAALRRGWNVDVWVDDSPEYVAKQNIFGRG